MNQLSIVYVVTILVCVILFPIDACSSLGLVSKSEVIVETAKNFLGVLEKGRNQGEIVEMFQKHVDGRAVQEPWCMSFVQFVIDSAGENEVYNSEHVYTVWLGTSPYKKFGKPKPGYIALWRRIKNGKLTTSGHTGIVVSVDNHGFTTVEGNVKEGKKEGVFLKKRKMGIQGSLKLLGFIKPW